MDDLISRAAAIETVRKAKDKSEAHRMLIQLPSVDAVPVRHGRWIIGDDGSLHCSKCSKTPISRIIVHGIQIFDMAPVKEMMKYCPNCGAKMDGKDGDAVGTDKDPGRE